jgi:hypothetical protein
VGRCGGEDLKREREDKVKGWGIQEKGKGEEKVRK